MKKIIFASLFGAAAPFVMLCGFDTRFPIFVSAPFFVTGLFLSIFAFSKSLRILKSDKENHTAQFCIIATASSFVGYLLTVLLLVVSVAVQTTPF